MKAAQILRTIEKFTIDNSPGILTGIGVVGTLTTAYLTGRASWRAADLIADEKERLGLRTMTSREKFDTVWKLYIPPAGSAVATMGAIIMANQIGGRRTAAIAAAYAVSERAYTEYKDRVVQTMGAPKEQAMRDALAQDRVNANPPSKHIIVLGSDVMCFDVHSGRYFTSSMEQIKSAQNQINHKVNTEMYATLSDFYYLLNIDSTGLSDDVGWNSDKLLELQFSTCISPDGRPALSLEYNLSPIRGFCRLP